MKCFNEPWRVFVDEDGKDKCTYIDSINVGPIPDSIAHVFGENRDVFARRIVACVNACEGLTTEYLETDGLPEFAGKTLCADMVQQEIERVTAQRDQLLVALELLMERIPEPPDANCSCHISPPCNDCVDYAGEREAFEFAKEAISKVKGGAPC